MILDVLARLSIGCQYILLHGVVTTKQHKVDQNDAIYKQNEHPFLTQFGNMVRSFSF